MKRRGGRPEKKAGKKQKKNEALPEGLEDEDDDFFDAGEGFDVSSSGEDGDKQEEGDEQAASESVHEKKVRLAKAYLDKVKARVEQEEDADDGDENAREEREGRRDSRVADLLRQEQLEETGKVQRDLASRVVKPVGDVAGVLVVRKHRKTVTALTLSEDDKWGFSASKDGLILQWDVESGSSFKFKWPSDETMTGLNTTNSAKRAASKRVLALAVDSSGRYLATGGPDRAVHLWDVRSRQHIQVFPGHKGAVSALAFRQGTSVLISGSSDRTIKLWSADDRSYLETLFGHQSEVLGVDCLRQERVLSAGRDRTVRLWKIPEETQLVFRGQAPSLESCCFITNSEFLSGSDDGSVALWNTMKKKPVFVVKHAHGPPEASPLENGHVPPEGSLPTSCAADYWVGAVASCRGSDLVASGAGDGKVQLYAVEGGNRVLRPLHSLPVAGFVNSLAFARSGRFLVAGVGQEPRLGRWARHAQAKNGVIIHNIELST